MLIGFRVVASRPPFEVHFNPLAVGGPVDVPRNTGTKKWGVAVWDCT